MKHNLLYINCPVCGKQLIDLAPFSEGVREYWCDDCHINIDIEEEEENEESEEE